MFNKISMKNYNIVILRVWFRSTNNNIYNLVKIIQCQENNSRYFDKAKIMNYPTILKLF